MEMTLPKGWKWVRLGEVCKLLRGVTYSKQEAVRAPREGYLPILRANNITSELNYDDLVYVPEEKISRKQLIKKGDIIIAMSSGSKNIVGKAAQASEDFNGGFGAFCGLVRPNGQVDSEFLGFFFRGSFYRQEVSRLSIGANINNLRREHIESMKMPLPPLTTQKKIVEILEEANVLRGLRKAADEKMKDLTPSIFVKMFGDTATNPKGWEIKKLGEILKRKTEQILPINHPETKFTYIGLEHIESNTGCLACLNKEFGKNIKSAKNQFVKGDILYGKLRPYLNKVWLADMSGICSTDIWVIRPVKELTNGHFISTFLKFKQTVNMLDSCTEGANLPRVKASFFDGLSVPLPPLPLQQEFAARAEEIEAEKARQAESKAKLDDLFNSLMQKAFKGELVA